MLLEAGEDAHTRKTICLSGSQPFFFFFHFPFWALLAGNCVVRCVLCLLVCVCVYLRPWDAWNAWCVLAAACTTRALSSKSAPVQFRRRITRTATVRTRIRGNKAAGGGAEKIRESEKNTRCRATHHHSRLNPFHHHLHLSYKEFHLQSRQLL